MPTIRRTGDDSQAPLVSTAADPIGDVVSELDERDEVAGRGGPTKGDRDGASGGVGGHERSNDELHPTLKVQSAA